MVALDLRTRLAHATDVDSALNLDLIAEGVETAGQAEQLLELGCTTEQGFLFCRPVSVDRWPELAAARPRRPR